MSYAPGAQPGDGMIARAYAAAINAPRLQPHRQATGIMLVSGHGQQDPALGALLAEQTTGPIGTTHLSANAELGDLAVLKSGYEIIVLDLGPEDSPTALCRQLARVGNTAAIVILSPRDESPEVVGALDGGAVDYIVKPYRRYELAARIRNAIRGACGRLEASTNIGPFWFSAQTRTLTVRRSGTCVGLSALEAEVLKMLLRAPGSSVAREALENHLWSAGTSDRRSTLSTIVWRLRRKLATEPDGPRILRHSRAGYTLLDWSAPRAAGTPLS